MSIAVIGESSMKTITPNFRGVSRMAMDIPLISEVEMFNVLRKKLPNLKLVHNINFNDRGIKYTCKKQLVETAVNTQSLVDISSMFAIEFVDQLMQAIADEIEEYADFGFTLTHFYTIEGFQGLDGKKYKPYVQFKIVGVFRDDSIR